MKRADSNIPRSSARLNRPIGGFLFILGFLVCGCQRLNYPNSEELPNTPFDHTTTIGIIVNKHLYPSIRNSIHSYASDLITIEARKVWIDGESFDSTSSPQALRDSLALLHGRVDLDGVVLIGDLPVAWYEIANDLGSSGYASFPIDLYFMDLNGAWLDTAKDGAWGGNAHTGVFDGHSGNMSAEIWVSRIKASTMQGDEKEIVNSYFDRVHNRMIGNDSLPSRGLLFQDCWAGFPGPDFNGDILYPPGAVDTFTNEPNSPHSLDSKENWIAALRKGYEYVQLAEHGSAGGNQFEGVDFFIPDYVDMTNGPGGISNVRFYNLFSCSNARYTQPNIATYYALGHNGLIALGPTKSGGIRCAGYFHAPLANGESFGVAFKKWFNAFGLSSGTNFTGASYEMALIGAGNLKLHPYSIKTIHQIIATKNEGGSLNREGRIAIADGDSTTIIITPENNYQIDLVLVDGDTIFTKSFPAYPPYDQNNRTIPAIESYTFHAVHEDHWIHVRFVQRKEYKVTMTVQGDGFINQCTGLQRFDTSCRAFEGVFYEGDIIDYKVASHFAATYFTFTPFVIFRWSYEMEDLAQIIASISDNGKEISSALGKASYYTSFQLFADHQIAAVFKAVNVFNVKVIVEGNGTYDMYDPLWMLPAFIDSRYFSGDFIWKRDADSIYVRQNENLLFRTTADTGYTLTSILIDSIPLSAGDILLRQTFSSKESCYFPLQNITASHTILLSFGRNCP